jgi:dienelactone hydrolase
MRRLMWVLWLCACSTESLPLLVTDAAEGGGDAGGGGGSGSDGSSLLPDAGQPPPATCAPQRKAGHQDVTCGDVTFEVESSAACAAGGQACGLILDVHGWTMSADQENEHTRMRTLATARGYVVVQPTAPGVPASWGEGEHDEKVWSFFLATAAVFESDPDRLHVMGFSQGGMMTNRLICKYADKLASVAPTAGARCFNEGKKPPVEIPILYTHGTADYIVSFHEGEALREGVLAAWSFGAPVTIGSGPEYVARRWTTANGTDFEFWQHDFKAGFLIDGHCLPAPTPGGAYRCQGDGQFDHSLEVLRFFDDHPRR